MTYPVLKVPLNPNQPTNSLKIWHCVCAGEACDGGMRELGCEWGERRNSGHEGVRSVGGVLCEGSDLQNSHWGLPNATYFCFWKFCFGNLEGFCSETGRPVGTTASTYNSICIYLYNCYYICWFTAKWPLFSSCLLACLFVCLCRVFLSRLWSDFNQIWTYVICLGLVVSPRI